MTNHEKVCWYCGSENMKPVKTWFQCQDCDATHVPQSKRTFAPVTEFDDETGGSPRPGRPSHFSPSGQVVRAAEKAREKASRS